MVALNFQERFAELVASGAKTQTIRARRKDARDPVAGKRLQLYTGLRQPGKTRKLVEPDPFCIATTPLVLHARLAGVPLGPEVGLVWLNNRQREALARADGFASYAEMAEWFIETHGLPFSGLLIRWGAGDA